MTFMNILTQEKCDILLHFGLPEEDCAGCHLCLLGIAVAETSDDRCLHKELGNKFRKVASDLSEAEEGRSGCL